MRPAILVSVALACACSSEPAVTSDGGTPADAAAPADASAPLCVPACPTFSVCCPGPGGATCQDTVNDPSNCGGCGVVCPSGWCAAGECL